MVSTEVPADFACEPLATETREMLTARDKVLAGRVEFEKKCSLNGEIGSQLDAIADRIRSSDKPQEINGLFEAKKLVDACIVAGRATGLWNRESQDYLKKSADFANSNTLDRNRFNIAVEAFWRGTAHSNMAIGVAVAQDAFILVLKLLADIFGREMKPRVRPASGVPVDISDREQDPPEIRAVKALLRLAHPAPNHTSEFELESANSNLPSEVRENLKAFMNRMVRQDRAHVSRRGVYVIENSTIHEFEAELRTQPKAPVKSAGTDSRHSGRRNRVGATGVIWLRLWSKMSPMLHRIRRSSLAIPTRPAAGGGRRRLRGSIFHQATPQTRQTQSTTLLPPVGTRPHRSKPRGSLRVSARARRTPEATARAAPTR